MQSTQKALGQFSTPKASGYLQQLCKHFAHKIPVTFEETSGEISFPIATCTLAASDDELQITVTATTLEDLERAKAIIDSHLERFAFREGFKTMYWS
ncbi:DUF2218 domain-containing protein [Limnospira fusiformis CCALA 023]